MYFFFLKNNRKGKWKRRVRESLKWKLWASLACRPLGPGSVSVVNVNHGQLKTTWMRSIRACATIGPASLYVWDLTSQSHSYSPQVVIWSPPSQLIAMHAAYSIRVTSINARLLTPSRKITSAFERSYIRTLNFYIVYS